MNLMPSSAASSRPCSSVTARLSDQSHLLPIRILFTPSEACCSMFACQVRMSAAGHETRVFQSGKRRRTVERAFVCYVVDKENAHSTPVVRCRDGPEAFLARSIPL